MDPQPWASRGVIGTADAAACPRGRTTALEPVVDRAGTFDRQRDGSKHPKACTLSGGRGLKAFTGCVHSACLFGLGRLFSWPGAGEALKTDVTVCHRLSSSAPRHLFGLPSGRRKKRPRAQHARGGSI